MYIKLEISPRQTHKTQRWIDSLLESAKYYPNQQSVFVVSPNRYMSASNRKRLSDKLQTSKHSFRVKVNQDSHIIIENTLWGLISVRFITSEQLRKEIGNIPSAFLVLDEFDFFSNQEDLVSFLGKEAGRIEGILAVTTEYLDRPSILGAYLLSLSEGKYYVTGHKHSPTQEVNIKNSVGYQYLKQQIKEIL